MTPRVLLPFLSLVVGGCIGVVGPAPRPADDQPSVPFSGAAPRYSNGPGHAVDFLDFPQQKAASEAGAVLTDIESHLPASYGGTYRDSDKITHGHETTHGINSELRNKYGGYGSNGFYVLENRGVIVKEPNMRKSAVAAFVPSGLRGQRFSLYITGQTAWDDTPLYIFDEWVAYTNGGAVGVDLVNSNLWSYGWRDGVAGVVEFTVYGLATAMAVEKHDPQYFQSNKQFREFVAFQARRAQKVFFAGKAMSVFKYAKQDEFFERFKSGAAGASIRDFVKRIYGEPFLREILGQDPPPPDEPQPDAGTPQPDAGTPQPDTGTPQPDAGTPQPDAGTPQPDTGTPPAPGADSDGDGVPDIHDLCSATSAGAPVWPSGAWIGCAGGQFRDPDDSDRDGVPNVQDLCSHTPLGRAVWFSGEWIGCAGGEYRDS